MGAFPRSVFSESELEAVRWFATKQGISDLPSVRVVKGHRSEILNVAGVSTETIEGGLGNLDQQWHKFS